MLLRAPKEKGTVSEMEFRNAAPVTATLDTVTDDPPELVRETCWVTLEPATTLPNATFVGRTQIRARALEDMIGTMMKKNRRNKGLNPLRPLEHDFAAWGHSSLSPSTCRQVRWISRIKIKMRSFSAHDNFLPNCKLAHARNTNLLAERPKKEQES